MLIVTGTIKIALHERNVLLEAAHSMMLASRQEPGCMTYDITAALADPAQFHIFELWQDQAALDDHFHSPHMATFQEAITGKVTQMTIKQYEANALPSD